ncbi:hypothetical protein SISNIDRAFT_180559 [Sistotremastrum niveocremeum HHB9708]|uniref:Uncharacterized protein n=1 Tax=Sistotremastrum niveocremeum HHB9708 TaxID=1314777 RepID=A0A164RDY1_9AGAM|nr:hypothetical protein SISNIDRAFT_180559 [Sistotremastrum niveocremeum HHB9708]
MNATAASGRSVCGPVAATSARYAELQLQDAQSGTFRIGPPFTGTYFTLSNDYSDMKVHVAAPDGNSRNLWIFMKRIRLNLDQRSSCHSSPMSDRIGYFIGHPPA